MHAAVGIGSASFWRGMWYVLDDQLYPESPFYSASSSLVMGTGLLAASQGLLHRTSQVVSPKLVPLPLQRFGSVYLLATSCVLLWRGTWMMWDVAYERWSGSPATDPKHLSRSGMVSHAAGIGGMLVCGVFASVLSPPAATAVIKDAAVMGGKRAVQHQQRLLSTNSFASSGRLRR